MADRRLKSVDAPEEVARKRLAPDQFRPGDARKKILLAMAEQIGVRLRGQMPEPVVPAESEAEGSDRRQRVGTPDEIARARVGAMEFRKEGDSAAILAAMLAQIEEETTPPPPELSPEEQALGNYQVQYEALGGTDWESVRERLLANGKLEKAMALKEAVIFSVEVSGAVLFSDGTPNNLHEGTLDLPYEGAKVKIEAAGYDFFSKAQMRDWEAVTEQSFLVDSYYSYLESGDLLPTEVRYCGPANTSDYTQVSEQKGSHHGIRLGARRLLVV